MVSRYIPADVRRELRRESNFGCAYCGMPLIEYHHIVPFSEEEHHDPSRMISLCPTCHAEADAKTIKQKELYELKSNPIIADHTGHDFYFNSERQFILLGESMSFGMGGASEQVALAISGESIINMYYEDEILTFSVKFFNDSEEVVAAVDKGEWWADVDEVWDISYKKKVLKLWSEPRNIGMAINYKPDNDFVYIKGHFQYDGKLVQVRDDEITINGNIHFRNIEIDPKDDVPGLSV